MVTVNSDVYGASWPVGSEIEMFGERLVIVENLGAYGVVKRLGGEVVSGFWYWSCLGEKAELVLNSV